MYPLEVSCREMLFQLAHIHQCYHVVLVDKVKLHVVLDSLHKEYVVEVDSDGFVFAPRKLGS